jgi:predicted ATPase
MHAARGFTSPELDDVYARARELCQRLGDAPQLLSILIALVIVYGNRAEHQEACEIARKALSSAKQVGNPAFMTPAHYGLGWNLMFLGKLDQGRAHLERAVACYDREYHRSHVLVYAYDCGVIARSSLAWALWFLGYPDQALAQVQESLALAEELVHPPSLALAQGLGCVLHAVRRDARAVRELAEACIHLSSEQGFPYSLGMGVIFRGWALAHQGWVEEGSGEMHQAMVQAQVMGIGVGHPHRLILLAQIYGNSGRVGEGLELLAEALDASRCTGECVYDAEIHRVKGELLLLQRDESEAKVSFQRAIEVASGQSAKSWELRAATSLCRLWQKQGKRKKARRELAATYNWFTEGFDTADLKEAKALLEELS